MDGMLKIAVVLTAVDKMNDILDSATSKADKKLQDLAKSAKSKFASGLGLLTTGVAITNSMATAVSAYSRLETAQVDLQSSMMDANGAISEHFKGVSSLAESLGNELPGTTSDFYTLFQTMMNNGVKAEQIIGGVGKAAAHLAVDLKMPYEAAGEFAARMKEATGVADGEMLDFMDTISRAKNAGLGVDEMKFAFSRSAGTLKAMGLQGLSASKDMTSLYAILIRGGQSGETAATSFKNISQSIMDPEKLSKVQAEAKKLGVSFNFFKDGKFAGIENMMKEFDKVKNIDPRKTAGLVEAIGGGGSGGEAMRMLFQSGAQGYDNMVKEIAGKASLEEKIKLKLGTLASMWEATTGTIENMMASLGAGLAPILKPIVETIGMIAGKIKEFLDNNPALAQFLTMAVSLVGVFFMLLGAVKIIQGIRIAMQVLNVTMKANPFILFASIAILVLSLIYAHWGKIKDFFAKIWNAVKSAFSTAVGVVKTILLNFTPVGLIFKHWDKIKAFFVGIWEGVKGVFTGFIDWIMGLGTRLYEAGKNIINSIWEGIKSMVMGPINAVKDMVSSIRDFLPFSPAKTGPLKDIHRIKLVETIAEGIKPAPMVQAMQRVTGLSQEALMGSGSFKALSTVGMGGMGGGGTSVNFTINLNGGTKNDAMLVAAECKKQFQLWMKDYNNQQNRVKFT